MIKDITDLCSLFKREISYLIGNFFLWMSCCYKNVASWKSIKVCLRVSFYLRTVPNFVLLSCLYADLSELVKCMISIHMSPKWFSISRIISSFESLFCPVVKDGNSLNKHVECDHWGKMVPIWISWQESSIVMIIHEYSQNMSIFEFLSIVLKDISEFPHWSLISIHIVQSVPKRIIQKSRDVMLVTSNILSVSIQNFSNWIDFCSSSEFTPKPFWNFRNRVDSESVNVVFINDVSGPFK